MATHGPSHVACGADVMGDNVMGDGAGSSSSSSSCGGGSSSNSGGGGKACEPFVHGGGGYGSPLDRDPEMVAHDVREEYVSAARAASVYGVVVDGEGQLDRAATDKLRADMTA